MIGVAYGPADNGSVATYAVLAQVGRETFTVARVAVTAPDARPGIRDVRRMRATGTQIRVMRCGPGGLESVMVHPWPGTRDGAQWARRKPTVNLPDPVIHPAYQPVELCPCGCGSLTTVATPQ